MKYSTWTSQLEDIKLYSSWLELQTIFKWVNMSKNSCQSQSYIYSLENRMVVVIHCNRGTKNPPKFKASIYSIHITSCSISQSPFDCPSICIIQSLHFCPKLIVISTPEEYVLVEHEKMSIISSKDCNINYIIKRNRKTYYHRRKTWSSPN